MSKHLVSTVLSRSAELEKKENEIKIVLGLVFRSFCRGCTDTDKDVVKRNYEAIFGKRTLEFVIYENLGYRWVFCNFEKSAPQEIRFLANTGRTLMRFDDAGTLAISADYIDMVHEVLQGLFDGMLEKFPFVETRLYAYLKV